MATRSSISILNDDGSVDSIYCHFDGYQSGVGKILNDHYNTIEKAKELISKGDASYIKSTIAECKFYTSMGEDLKIHHFSSIQGFNYSDMKQQFNYIFKNGEWVCSRVY